MLRLILIGLLCFPASAHTRFQSTLNYPGDI